MYVFDTDVISLIFHHPGKFPHLESRTLAIPQESLFISIVTAEELIQGAFKLIRQEQQKRRGTNGYRLLQSVIEDIRRFSILPFDDACRAELLTFPPALRRIGRADCMIAASALHHNFTVVTRNESDFRQIPNLRVENWTLPPAP